MKILSRWIQESSRKLGNKHSYLFNYIYFSQNNNKLNNNYVYSL